MSSLGSEYTAIFDETLRTCAQTRMRGSRQNRVTAFWPAVGDAFQAGRSIMVVGRAVNGWAGRSLDLSTSPSETSIVELRRQAQQFAESSARLTWLSDDPNDWTDNYNPHRSQFWAVARHLVESDCPEGPWYEDLAWSNLYKVAPSEGGNPGVALSRAQSPRACELLKIELRSFAPKCVVFLTGWGWAKDIIPPSAVRERSPSRLVEAVGRWSDIPFVVAPHPQSRSIDAVGVEVLAAMASA